MQWLATACSGLCTIQFLWNESNNLVLLEIYAWFNEIFVRRFGRESYRDNLINIKYKPSLWQRVSTHVKEYWWLYHVYIVPWLKSVIIKLKVLIISNAVLD
jgi:hypothetical protein